MDDESFEQLFVPLMDNIMARYQPDAIVLQSGECWRHNRGGGSGLCVCLGGGLLQQSYQPDAIVLLQSR